ncbi:MAG: class I SAM-dependent methyltransferase [Acidiferrobacteraceae bacterium]
MRHEQQSSAATPHVIQSEPPPRKQPRPRCALCGHVSVALHTGLQDRLFGAAGTWDLVSCTNPGCGLVWLDPMPSDRELGKAYEAYHTHAATAPRATPLNRMYGAIRDGYLKRRYGYHQGTGPRWLRHLAPLVWLHPAGPERFGASAMFLRAPSPGARLLDIGCGNGMMLLRLQTLGWDAEGIDADAEAVKAAQASGAHARHGTLAAGDYPNDCFDAILVNHVLEHVPDPLQLLTYCRQILRPGGSLVVITPNTDSWGCRRFGRNWRGFECPRHLYLFNVRSLGCTARKAGLIPSTLNTLAKGADHILSMSRFLERHENTGTPVADRKYRVSGMAYLTGERLLRLWNTSVGEELLMIATK